MKDREAGPSGRKPGGRRKEVLRGKRRLMGRLRSRLEPTQQGKRVLCTSHLGTKSALAVRHLPGPGLVAFSHRPENV